MKHLISEIRQCTFCEPQLPCGANPIVVANEQSKIALISQAPGSIAHKSGTAWNDPGGKQLKNWLGVTEDQFYNPDNFAILPMSFCYPGKGKTGDLPPRKECAPLWHPRLLPLLKNVRLKIYIGQYAQQYYLKSNEFKNLTERVRHFHEFLPDSFPIPHPSPRNRFWLQKNSWFVSDVLPNLKDQVNKIIV